MADKNKTPQESNAPEPLKDILPKVIERMEDGVVPEERSAESSIRYEKDTIASLRDQAQLPETSDEERADLAHQIHESELAIRGLEEGRGHSPDSGNEV